MREVNSRSWPAFFDADSIEAYCWSIYAPMFKKQAEFHKRMVNSIPPDLRKAWREETLKKKNGMNWKLEHKPELLLESKDYPERKVPVIIPIFQ